MKNDFLSDIEYIKVHKMDTSQFINYLDTIREVNLFTSNTNDVNREKSFVLRDGTGFIEFPFRDRNMSMEWVERLDRPCNTIRSIDIDLSIFVPLYKEYNECELWKRPALYYRQHFSTSDLVKLVDSLSFLPHLQIVVLSGWDMILNDDPFPQIMDALTRFASTHCTDCTLFFYMQNNHPYFHRLSELNQINNKVKFKNE